MKHWRKPFPGCIPVGCYALALVCWLLFGTGWLALDGLACLTGKLQPQALPLADCELVAMERQGETDCLAVTADPQFIWINPDGRTVRSLTLDVTHTGEAGEMALYYIGAEGEAFSREKRVFPHEAAPGRFVFHLPAAQVYALRLDPCSSVQLLKAVSLEMNTSCPLWLYYRPGWMQLFALLLLPGLAASGISTARQALLAWQAHQKRKSGTA